MRAALVAAARRLDRLGLNRGTSGNLSIRLPDGLLITPSAVSADRLEPDHVVEVAADGTVAGVGRPSSEWRIHRDVYAARSEVGAVVHAHPAFATTIACLGREIPAFHYMVAVAGGDSIRCAPYATFGTQELSDAVVAALAGRRACLLANHGMVAVAADLDGAVALAVEVEALAEMYWRALAVGPPVVLDATQMAEVAERFSTYRPGY